MGNADYVAAFLHVLLPVAFEVTAWGAGVVLMAGEGEGDPLSRVPPPHTIAEWNPPDGECYLEGPPSPLLRSLSCPSPRGPAHSLTLSWCSSQQDLTLRSGILR